MSKDGRDSATLILMKISHFDRTALYVLSFWLLSYPFFQTACTFCARAGYFGVYKKCGLIKMKVHFCLIIDRRTSRLQRWVVRAVEHSPTQTVALSQQPPTKPGQGETYTPFSTPVNAFIFQDIFFTWQVKEQSLFHGEFSGSFAGASAKEFVTEISQRCSCQRIRFQQLHFRRQHGDDKLEQHEHDG